MQGASEQLFAALGRMTGGIWQMASAGRSKRALPSGVAVLGCHHEQRGMKGGL